MVHRFAGLPQLGQHLPSSEPHGDWSKGMQSVLAPDEGARSSSSILEAARDLQERHQKEGR